MTEVFNPPSAAQVFPNLIFRDHYSGFKPELLVPVCEGLIRGTRMNAYLEEGDANSSVMNTRAMPHTLAVFKPFYDWLWPRVEHIIYNEWNLDPNTKYWINDSWVNRHGPGGQTAAHTHGHAVMAISAYIQVPELSGNLEMLDPLEMMWRMYYRKHRPDAFTQVKITQGDVVFFPGWVEHKTQISRAEQGLDRWVLTTNIFSHRTERADSRAGAMPGMPMSDRNRTNPAVNKWGAQWPGKT